MTKRKKNLLSRIAGAMISALKNSIKLDVTRNNQEPASKEPPSFKRTAEERIDQGKKSARNNDENTMLSENVEPDTVQKIPLVQTASPLNDEASETSEPGRLHGISRQIPLKDWVNELSAKNLSAYEAADEIITLVMSAFTGLDEELCVNSISQALSDLLRLDPEVVQGRMNNESIWTLLECLLVEMSFNRICDDYRDIYGLNGNSLKEAVSQMNRRRDELKSIISAKIQPLKTNETFTATFAVYSLLQIVVIYDVTPIKKTQSQLARDIGVSQQFISQFFLKKRTMSWRRAKRAASLTNTEPGWWCDGDVERIKSAIMIEERP